MQRLFSVTTYASRRTLLFHTPQRPFAHWYFDKKKWRWKRERRFIPRNLNESGKKMRASNKAFLKSMRWNYRLGYKDQN